MTDAADPRIHDPHPAETPDLDEVPRASPRRSLSPPVTARGGAVVGLDDVTGAVKRERTPLPNP